jgi:hypothetical protein
LFDDLKKLEGLSFPIGLTKASAVHFTRPEGPSLENEMTPRVRFTVSNTADGWPVLHAMLDFSECAIAEKLGQKSMLLAMDRLTPVSLESLAAFVPAFVAAMKKPKIDEPPGEVT